MKSLIIAAVLFPYAAFACPDLSGHFLCKDFTNGSEQDVVMAQTTTNGVVTYTMTINSQGKTVVGEYITDGVAHPVENPDFAVRTNRSYCDGNKVKKEVQGTRRDNGETLNALVTIYITPEGNLYDDFIGKQGNMDIRYEEVCQRIP